jgi:hypothetical protein
MDARLNYSTLDLLGYSIECEVSRKSQILRDE